MVSTVVVRSGIPIRRAEAFCTPIASASSAITASRGPATIDPWTMTTTTSAAAIRTILTAAATLRSRSSAKRRASRPPATDPTKNAPTAVTVAVSEISVTPAAANPTNTMFPVMLTTKT